MKRTLVASLVAACFAWMPMLSAASQDEEPDATIEMEGGTLSFFFGYDWADGTLKYEGREYRLNANGVSIMRLGAGNSRYEGQVYHLHDIADFPGHYVAVSAGAALLTGGSGMAMRNENGVVIEMTSTTGGVDLNFGIKGLSVSLR